MTSSARTRLASYVVARKGSKRAMEERSLGSDASCRRFIWHGGHMTWVLDCDGVVWLADVPIPGAAEAVARLKASGQRVVFLTNNSWPRRADHLEKLKRMGMPTAGEDLISSPMAAASLLERGDRALVLGGPGVIEALTDRGVEVTEPGGAGAGDAAAGAVAAGANPAAGASPRREGFGVHGCRGGLRLVVRLRPAGGGDDRPAGRCTPHRHERRRHLPDEQGAASRRRLIRRCRRQGGRSHPGRRRQALRAGRRPRPEERRRR